MAGLKAPMGKACVGGQKNPTMLELPALTRKMALGCMAKGGLLAFLKETWKSPATFD